MKNKKQNQANKNNSDKEPNEQEILDNSSNQNLDKNNTESEVVDQTNNKEKLKYINKNEEVKPFGKNYYIGLIITIAVVGILVLCLYFYELYILEVKNIYKNLCDAFFIPSIIGVLFYLLNLVSKEGAFDAIAYSVKLVFYTTFYSNIRKTKLPSSYREYRELKRGKKRTSPSFLLAGSLPYLICSILFYILYHTL